MKIIKETIQSLFNTYFDKNRKERVSTKKCSSCLSSILFDSPLKFVSILETFLIFEVLLIIQRRFELDLYANTANILSQRIYLECHRQR